jgi:hypothetical protein
LRKGGENALCGEARSWSPEALNRKKNLAHQAGKLKDGKLEGGKTEFFYQAHAGVSGSHPSTFFVEG